TSFSRDWSSDVCSSDLYAEAGDKFLALQYRENAEGKRLALDGELITSDGTRRRIGDLELDIDFVAGSRAYKHVKLDVTLEDDTTDRKSVVEGRCVKCSI